MQSQASDRINCKASLFDNACVTFVSEEGKKRKENVAEIKDFHHDFSSLWALLHRAVICTLKTHILLMMNISSKSSAMTEFTLLTWFEFMNFALHLCHQWDHITNFVHRQQQILCSCRLTLLTQQYFVKLWTKAKVCVSRSIPRGTQQVLVRIIRVL